MESTLDPSSVRERQRYKASGLVTSNVCCEIIFMPSNELQDEKDLTSTAEEKENIIAPLHKLSLKCSHFCSSTLDNVSKLFSRSSPVLYRERKTEACSCLEVNNGCCSRIHEQCKDTDLGSMSSHDTLRLSTDKRHGKVRVKCNETLNYSSTGQASTPSAAQYDRSKFLNSISHNKNKPPVVYTHIHHKRTFFYTFSNLLFLTFLLASLLSPSLSLTTSLASSSPNLKSWSSVALETVDSGTEKDEINSHRVPIPDVTAIVGKLFQFQIPESAFSEEVTKFKAIQAGSRELPKWIHLDEITGQLTGVPFPKDKGQIYISVDGHMALDNGKVSVESTIFSLNILQPNISDNTSRLKYPNLDDRALDCNHSSLARPVESCLPNKTPVLVNILFLVSFDSLTPLERTELFINTAKLFDTCLEHLELRLVNWTTKDGVWLWSELATSEIIDTLESSTILSFQAGCGNFNYFTQSSLLGLLSRSTDICRDGLLLSDEGYLWVTCHQWFITAGTKTFLSEAMFDLNADNRDSDNFDEFPKNERFVRQADYDGTDGGIGILPPGFGDGDDEEGVTSSSSTTISSSSSLIETSSMSTSSSFVFPSSALVSSSRLQSSMTSDQTSLTSISSSQTSSARSSSGFPSSMLMSTSVSTSQISSRALVDITSSPSFSRDPMISDTQTSGQSLAISSTASPVTTQVTPTLTTSTLQYSSSISSLFPSPFSSTEVITSSLVESSHPPSAQPLISSMPFRASSLAQRELQTTEIATPDPTSTVRSGDPSSSTSASSEIVMPTRFTSRSVRSLTTLAPGATPQPRSMLMSTSNLPPISSIMVSSSTEKQTRSSSLPAASSLVDTEEPIGETTAVMMIITPSATTPRVSFSIASTIEVLSSPTVEPSSSSLMDSSFQFTVASSDILEPFPFTSSQIDFTFTSGISDVFTTVVSTPVRTTNVLMPLPTSELSLSMSTFRLSSLVEETSSIFLPIFTSRMITSESPVLVSTSMEIFTFESSIVSFEPTSTVGVLTPSPTRSDGRLMPMSSSELTLSISMFAPSPLLSSTIVTTSQVASFSFPPSATFDMSSPLPTPSPSLTRSSEVPSISSSFFFVDMSSESLIAPLTSSFLFSTSSLLLPLPTLTPSVLTSDFLFSVSSSEFLLIPSSLPSSLPFATIVTSIPTSVLLSSAITSSSQLSSILVSPVVTPSPTTTFRPVQPSSSITFIFPSSMSMLAPFSSSILTEDLTSSQTQILVSPTPSPDITSTPVTSDVLTSSILFFVSSSEILLDPFSSTSMSTSSDLTPTPETSDISMSSILFFVTSSESLLVPFSSPSMSASSVLTPTPSTSDILSSSILFFITSSESRLVPFSSPSMSTSSVLTPTPVTSDISMSSISFFVSSSESLLVPFSSPSMSTSSVLTPTLVTSDISMSSISFFVSSSESLLVPFSSPSMSTSSVLTPTPATSDMLSSSILFFDTSSESLLVSFSSTSMFTSSFPTPTPVTSELRVTSTSSFSFFITSSESLLVLFSPTPFSTPTSSLLFFVTSSESVLLPFSSPSPSPTMSPSISISSFSSTSVSRSSSILVSPSPTAVVSICDTIDCNNGDCIPLDSGENFTGPEDNGDGLFICECYPGWTGMLCDMPLFSSSMILTVSPSPSPPPLSICDDVDCNNGSCMSLDFGENFTCNCLPEWTGEFCDISLVTASATLDQITSSEFVSSLSLLFTVSSSENVLLPFSTPMPTPSPSLSPTPIPSPVSPVCENINCSGNGECVDLGEEFNCSCYPGWTGDMCETDIDFCLPDGLGSCNETGTAMCIDGNSTHTCDCIEGFTGDLCSVDIDDCDPDPCFNNATCINLLFGMFLCDCPPGFTGILCNESISPCDPNPCIEPEEMCIITGPEDNDYICVILQTSSITIDATSTFIPSPTSIVATSSLTTSSVVVSSPVAITSSAFLSSSPIPIPTPVPPNSSPIVLNPIGTLLANEGQVAHFVIPEMTFYDPDIGTTSNLRLSLLDSSGNDLPNTTWIHINDGAIQALPLGEQAVMNLVTEYTFILRASDELGASTHDFITVRVLRQQVNFTNFLVVLFQGNFTTFSQNLTGRISLAQGLSAHVSGSNLNTVSSTPNIYIRTFRNGSIAVVYRDLSLLDTHCADFRAWVLSIYTNSAFTFDFIQRLPSEFVPISAPVIEGPCNMSDTNPTVALTPRIQPDPQSDLILFLATVIPTVAVACMCFLVGAFIFANYRRRRAERDGIRSRAMEKTFTRRRPIVLDEEWDLPNRRRKPVILPGDQVRASQPVGRRLLLEEFDLGGESDSSDEEEEARRAPGLNFVRRNRYTTMSPDPPDDEGPPPYVLPPLFPT